MRQTKNTRPCKTEPEPNAQEKRHVVLCQCLVGGFYFIREMGEDFPEEVTMGWQLEGRVVFNYVGAVGEDYEEKQCSTGRRNEH